MKRDNIIHIIAMFLLVPFFSSCDKYLDTQLPSGTISGENVYVSDNSVSSVVTGNFLSMCSRGVIYGGGSNIACLTGLFTDELVNITAGDGSYRDVYYKNALQNTTGNYWSAEYSQLYDINAAIEGISHTKATLFYKDQWLGESFFSRAFIYFYLVNIYGDVPLALTTDFKKNNNLSRAAQDQVYRQIIKDLQQSQHLLSEDYKDGFGSVTTERVRPNKAAATALLAKVYLYTKKWDSAEAAADSVIANTAYQLEPLDQVFTAGSKETVWALALPSSAGVSSYEYNFYNHGMPSVITSNNSPSTYSVYFALNDLLVNKFSADDKRLSHWIRPCTLESSPTRPDTVYYFPDKYSSATVGSSNEIMLRLGELYLIRAEARAEQEELDGALSDLNAIRVRAGLKDTTLSSKTALLKAIAIERQRELFTECGNRFFDLKRTGTIDAVMDQVAPLKGASWESYMQLWPIPPADILQDPGLEQNPGY